MEPVGVPVRHKGPTAARTCWPFAATFVFFGFLWRTQRQIAVSGGAGWDGFFYLRMAIDLPAPQPYCLRIGYPFLVKFCSGPLGPLATFGFLAKVFGLVYGCTSAFVLRKVVPNCRPMAYVFAWSALNLSEMSPLRQAFWYPTNTDIPVNLLFLVLAWATLALKPGLQRNLVLTCCVLLGTLVRENFPFNLLLVCAVDFLEFDRGAVLVRVDKSRVITLLCGCAAVLISFSTIRYVLGEWPMAHKNEDVMTNLLSQQFIALFGALLSGYGFAWLVALAKRGEPRSVYPPWAPGALLFLLATLPVAIVGGADTERFLFWYMFVVTVLSLPKINALCEGKRWFELSVIAAFFLFTHRTFIAINTQGRMSGCSFYDFIGKTSPALIGYSRMCVASTVSILLPVATLASVLLVSRRVRLRWGAA